MRASQKQVLFEVRKRSGNTLLTVGVVALVLFLITLGLVVFSGIFTQQRMSERADKAAMVAARIMNTGDRAGEINNMLIASRELVFADRVTYNYVLENNPSLQPFAKSLLDQSREGAQMMIDERDTIAKLTSSDLAQFVAQCNHDTSERGFSLPGIYWIGTDLPALTDLQVGYLQGTDSNVQSSENFPDLYDYDISQKCLNENTHLYDGNVTLTLPEPDSDLHFKICSLPAPVKGTIAPARLAAERKFQDFFTMVKNGKQQPGASPQLPTAAKLQVVINLQGLDKKVSQPMAIGATAATNGGSPRP
ncbi:MAG TPA: hypothetical protein V6C81_13060 [Planktothrix sp.]|jgi:Flp pilus assembly protein TadG